MYNDIVTTIGKGNGAMLVLLDLSRVFIYNNNMGDDVTILKYYCYLGCKLNNY